MSDPALPSAPPAAWSARELFLGLALLVVFGPALGNMAGEWTTYDYLSHGFLVPIVSIWAYLREQPMRERVPVEADGRGALLIAAALVVYLLGLGASVVSLQGLGFVAAVAGAAWTLRGAAWLRATAFPIGYLIFMVPPPISWITPMIVQLQLFVSSAAVVVSRALGVDLVRDGNILALPSGDELFVAEACSGVTSVITLTPLAVVLAAYALRTTGPRVALVLGVIPLAMLGNLSRVVLTVLIANSQGVELATEGPLHDLLGLSTYAVACLGMLGLAALLRRGGRA